MPLWLKLLLFAAGFACWMCVQIFVIAYANREARRALRDAGLPFEKDQGKTDDGVIA